MSEVLPPPVVQPRRRLRWKLLFFGGIILLLAAPVLSLLGVILYNRHRANQALEQALAEADGQDPDWRLADIEKRRTAEPPAENAAKPVYEAALLVPANWPTQGVYDGIDVLPPHQLDQAALQGMRSEMKRVELAVAQARRALKLKKGWFRIQWSPEFLATTFEHLPKVRHVGAVLQLDAALRSQDGSHAGAWQSCLNLLAPCKAIGEEPSIISQLVRIAVRAMTVATFERTLAQGTVDDDDLAEGQRLLLDEANEPLLLYALRGERANMDLLFANLENGSVDVSKVFGSTGQGSPNEIQFWWNGGTYNHDRAWSLAHFTRAIEIANGPAWELHNQLTALEQSRSDIPPLAGQVAPAAAKVGDAYLRSKSRLECASAALCVERFRVKKHRWPQSLDEVVAATLLDKVPIDVCNGKPLRYRKSDQGVVVYSVGPDQTYLGDMLDGNRAVEPDQIRYEFRLWELNHRRQPARPRPKEVQPPPDGDADK